MLGFLEKELKKMKAVKNTVKGMLHTVVMSIKNNVVTVVSHYQNYYRKKRV